MLGQPIVSKKQLVLERRTSWAKNELFRGVDLQALRFAHSAELEQVVLVAKWAANVAYFVTLPILGKNLIPIFITLSTK